MRERIATTYDAVERHPLSWLAPTLVLLGLFRLYPLLESLRMSFTNMSFIRPTYSYVGLQSYIDVLTSPGFGDMVVITVIFVGASLILQLSLGMLFALAIDYGVRKALAGSIATRVAILSAWVIPGIVIGIVWKIMLIETNYGVVNYVLLQLGFPIQSFLSDPQLALVSVITANTWRGTAFSMIMLYGGLQQVPRRLYNAARIDGANAIQRFRHVTVPQIKPVLFINLVLITIYTMNTFDMILSLTGGGPGKATEVLALYMYSEGFQRYNLGNAAAIAVLMLLVNIVMTIIYMRIFVKEDF